jgi:hypothetical protein
MEATMTLERLDSAIHELSEAKRLAELFRWPQEAIDRIDLLKRGATNLRARLLYGDLQTLQMRTNNQRALENIDRCREADANTYAIEG